MNRIPHSLNSDNERGTSMMEMLLFTPVALVFLFVAIDGGLALTERAAIKDALRAGLNTESRLADAPLTIDSMGELTPESELIGRLAEEIGTAISANILEIKGGGAAATRTYRVIVQPYLLNIEESSGALLEVTPIGAESVQPLGPSSFSIQAEVPDFNYVSQGEYIASLKELSQSAAPSQFAIPTSPSRSASVKRFLPSAIAIYTEVTGLTRGINPLFVRSVLGNFYALEEQEFLSLRNQLR